MNAEIPASCNFFSSIYQLFFMSFRRDVRIYVYLFLSVFVSVLELVFHKAYYSSNKLRK